jgi:hypothetical protein
MNILIRLVCNVTVVLRTFMEMRTKPLLRCLVILRFHSLSFRMVWMLPDIGVRNTKRVVLIVYITMQSPSLSQCICLSVRFENRMLARERRARVRGKRKRESYMELF